MTSITNLNCTGRPYNHDIDLKFIDSFELLGLVFACSFSIISTVDFLA